MRRRPLLSALGAGLVPLSGCVGGRALEPGQTHTAFGTSVTVSAPRVRKMVVEFTGVHTDVIAFEGLQFLVVDVSTNAPSAWSLDLDVAVDGQRAPAADRAARSYRVSTVASRRERQPLAFPVPADPDPRSAAVVWTRTGVAVRWDLGPDLVEDLGLEPRFTVESFEVPPEVREDIDFTATVTVSNTGERDGWFVAEVGDAALSDQSEFSVRVPMGATVSHDVETQVYASAGNEAAVVLRWPGRTMERPVSVV